MVLSLGLSDGSSWFNSGHSCFGRETTEVVWRFSRCIGRHRISVRLAYPRWCWLIDYWLRWSWPAFSNVKLMFSPLTLIKDILKLCKIACFLSHFHPCFYHLGLFSHWSNEVHRMGSEFQKLSSQGSLYSSPQPSMGLLFWAFHPPNKWHFSRCKWQFPLIP